MVPDSLHDPYELRPVVGAALVNDGLEPRVAVERVRDACEHTSLVKVLQAPCNLGRVQQLIGNRRTTIHKVHCHCPCAPIPADTVTQQGSCVTGTTSTKIRVSNKKKSMIYHSRTSCYNCHAFVSLTSQRLRNTKRTSCIHCYRLIKRVEKSEKK